MFIRIDQEVNLEVLMYPSHTLCKGCYLLLENVDLICEPMMFVPVTFPGTNPVLSIFVHFYRGCKAYHDIF